MNSTNHSSSSSFDVTTNHLNHNHNHIEKTNSKSLKRSRSPSLIQDELNDETPTKKNRKRRTTTDIDHSLGKHITADKIYVYRWPLDDLHADLHVLQEQICDFLSLKSFKRKYPDIYRRSVDYHEREYLKTQNIVSETQCDLGLTALKIDQVIQIMSDDYPEKYHQFNSIWQQKRRALLATNTNNLSTSITNNNNTKSLNTIEYSDNNNRISKFRQDLLRTTVDYNTQLQRERLQERKACFDLQTMQIHYPSNRQFRLPSNLTQIGSYPLALLPGQYQDSYRKYQSEELKYMPINTALYYYPKPLSLIHTDRFSQQNNSSDEEEETTTTTRPLTPQSPLVTINGQLTNTSRLMTKPSTPISSSNLCCICKIKQDDHDDDLVTCTSCQHSYHPVCLDVNQDMLATIKTYPWQCIDCKSCAKCTKTHDEANMMFCDRCDRGYHTYCVGLEIIPDGSWQCSACDLPSPVSPTKAKRGRPSLASRLSPQPIKIEPLPPTRVSSRRSRKILSSTPLSPSNNTNHSSNSSSLDLIPTNSSSSMNLILTRHQQQWTTISTEIKSKT